MGFSYYPGGASEQRIAAQAVLAAIVNPATPPELQSRLVGALERRAQALLDATSAKLEGVSAQEIARSARNEGDDDCDRKGMAFFQLARYRDGGAATWAELTKALGGQTPGEALREPDAAQVLVLDRFFALIDARTDLSYPKAAYEEFKAAHEVMKGLVRAEEATDAARDTLTLNQRAAEKSFAPAYRFLIRELLFNVGEDIVRDNLPRFERKSAKASGA